MHDFIVNQNGYEFRLGGKFGFGFKLYHRNYDDLYWFGQYEEDETEESKSWIERTNKYFQELIVD